MKLKNILVPVDFTAVTPRVVDCALTMATAFKSKIYLLHVAAPDPTFVGYKTGPDYMRKSVCRGLLTERKELYKIRDAFMALGIGVKTIIVQGDPADKILQEVQRFKADLLIMGAHLHGRLYRRIFGSVGASIFKKIPCPLVIIK